MIFAFHRTSSARGIIASTDDWRTILGHVEAFWCQPDRTWIFFDPQGRRSIVEALPDHRAEERIRETIAVSSTMLRIDMEPRTFRVPIHPIMTCAAQCGALLGIRAYTPRTLHRKLVSLGAETIHAQIQKTEA